MVNREQRGVEQMTMTDEQRDNFMALARHIASEVPELNETLLAEVRRSGEAFTEVDGALAKSIDKDDRPRVRQFFVEAQDSHKKLFQENLDLADVSIRALAGDTPIPRPKVPSEVHTASALDAAVRHMRNLSFGFAIQEFFTGMALILIQLSLEDYLSACEAFWGRRIGSHDAQRRLIAVLKELAIASAAGGALAFPPLAIPVALIRPAVEAVSQWRNTPRHKVFADLKDAKAILGRVDALADTASTLLERMFFVKGNVEISVDGVIEAREAM